MIYRRGKQELAVTEIGQGRTVSSSAEVGTSHSISLRAESERVRKKGQKANFKIT